VQRHERVERVGVRRTRGQPNDAPVWLSPRLVRRDLVTVTFLDGEGMRDRDHTRAAVHQIFEQAARGW
jgi:hypothetical protein